ncbi:protein aardvark [Anaeramoeba ignava]|uniref:Protein aardvark n=1 Tax=Anaeramoeba ignava TaxID=1746090 RepID=A0A9Q0R7R7_ANAIG|nr:protein aardvark [Anaeramoeba ignava]
MEHKKEQKQILLQKINEMKQFPQNEEIQQNGSIFIRNFVKEFGIDNLKETSRIQIFFESIKNFPQNKIIQENCIFIISKINFEKETQDQIRNTNGIDLIIKAMNNFIENEDIQKSGCGALWNISLRNQKNREQIRILNGIKAITQAMKNFPNNEDIQKEGSESLWCIAVNSEKNKDEIRNTNGIDLIIEAMNNFIENEDIQENGCGALWTIAVNNQENREQIRILNGIEAIIQAMKKFSENKDIQYQGCGALWNISVENTDNKDKIRELEGINYIIKAMEKFPKKKKIQENGCGALWNISPNRKNKIEIRKLNGIKVIIKAMEEFPNHEIIQENGCGALWTLASSEKDNKKEIGKSNGIKAIIEAMDKFIDKKDIQENGCGALWDIIADNKSNEIIFTELNGIKTILNAINQFKMNTNLILNSAKILHLLSSSNNRNRIIIKKLKGLEILNDIPSCFEKDIEIKNKIDDILSNLLLNSDNLFAISRNKGIQQTGVVVRQFSGNSSINLFSSNSIDLGKIKNNEVWFFNFEQFDIFNQNSNKQIKMNPIKIPIPENYELVQQISTGNYSTIFLFENGDAIEHLGDLNQDPQPIPIFDIRKVSVGEQNEAVLTPDGVAYAKGYDINSEKNEFTNISELIDNQDDKVIEDIISNFKTVYLLTSNQNAYGIGSNEYGQLGLDPKKIEEAKSPILMMQTISKIFSGSCSFCVFLLNLNQDLFGCGNNDYGQLGLGKIQKAQELTQIQNIPKGKIIDIQAGWYHSIMLIKENKKTTLYSCGDYHYNGLGKKENTYEFTEIKSPLFEDDNILDISCGNDHTLILTSSGKLIGLANNLYLSEFSNLLLSKPIEIELPKLSFDISNYRICSGYKNSLFYSKFFSTLEDDLLKLFRRKEFCDISFITKDGGIIGAHKFILETRIGQGDQIEEFREYISQTSTKDAIWIFETIYSNKKNLTESEKEIKLIFNLNITIEESIKDIFYLKEDQKEEKDKVKNFIIQKNEKQFRFPKLLLIARSELYRGMFLSVKDDESNKVTDYSELSEQAFEILEYWIYSNEIKEEITITRKIIEELGTGMDYFQLNESHPNLVDLLMEKFQEQEKKK